MKEPNPTLRRLDRLVGTWKIKGRTLDADHDNVIGQVSIEWFPGGFFMTQRGVITAAEFKVHGLEIIWYDPSSKIFPAYVFSNLGASHSKYFWDVKGNSVRHWTKGALYTGDFSRDGNTLSGGWRPTGRERKTAGNAYDVIMTRVRPSAHEGQD